MGVDIIDNKQPTSGDCVRFAQRLLGREFFRKEEKPFRKLIDAFGPVQVYSAILDEVASAEQKFESGIREAVLETGVKLHKMIRTRIEVEENPPFDGR